MTMAQTSAQKPADFIHPLNMNRLHGRMLRLPAPTRRKREILLVYGHHSSLERWWGLIQDLNQYGAVTVPDLPGFGGMDSFYKLHEQPTIDTMADYLAAFVKLRYKHRRVTIAGLSFGFVVVTRMLQRYPDLAKKVDMLVSVAGFAHHDDFRLPRWRYWTYWAAAKFFARRWPALFFRSTCLNPFVLRQVYRRSANTKFQGIEADQFNEMMDFEIYLWHSNDVRTHMSTCAEFLRLDNCSVPIDLPVWHVSVSGDQYFDEHMVEQHLRVIFRDYHGVTAQMNAHAPSILADKAAVKPLIPTKLRRALAAKP